MKDPTVSFPIRLSASLRDELKALAEECQVSDQDIMRLALRIGLLDLRSTGTDLPKLVKESADELGLSFTAFAKKVQKPASVFSDMRPILAAAAETTESPPVTEPRKEVIYTKKTSRKTD